MTGLKGLYIMNVVLCHIHRLSVTQAASASLDLYTHLSFRTLYNPIERAYVIASPISPQISREGG